MKRFFIKLIKWFKVEWTDEMKQEIFKHVTIA